MNYHIAIAKDQDHTLEISFIFEATAALTKIQIPYWRPGRYEAGKFGKNYVGMRASANGNALPLKKAAPNTFAVETPIGAKISLNYRCIAAELSAGNSYVDESCFIINPVNCLVYILGREDHPAHLSVQFPEGWSVATGLTSANQTETKANHRIYRSSGIQELFDSPIMAAPLLETLSYTVLDIPFHIHLAGEPCPDHEKLRREFIAFTESQVKSFAHFPVNEYHFLILLLPYKAYHGVEHENSTMIIFGPSGELTDRQAYKELLGISSHELYHTWNVKALRPADWTPYDFSQANFSRLGYVAEGVTTYMGDWMLWNGGYFSDAEFMDELSVHIQRHMDGSGRLNQSLADSSVDTWIDGYGKSALGRRLSIYGEGALLAWICDATLLRESGGDFGLNDVMRRLYEKFPRGKGYTEADYWHEMAADLSFDWARIRTIAVDGTIGLFDLLSETIAPLGLIIDGEPSPLPWESKHGLMLQWVGNNCHVSNIYSGSPSAKVGFWPGDQLLSINGENPKTHIDEKADLEGLKITVLRGQRLKNLTLRADGKSWRTIYRIAQVDSVNALFEGWANKTNLISSNT